MNVASLRRADFRVGDIVRLPGGRLPQGKKAPDGLHRVVKSEGDEVQFVKIEKREAEDLEAGQRAVDRWWTWVNS